MNHRAGVGRIIAGKEPVGPYRFVYPEPAVAVTDGPRGHDRLDLQDSGLFSGELCCEFQALTPLLAANYQYELQQAEPGLRQVVDELIAVRLSAIREETGNEPEVKEDKLQRKKVLEPLFLDGSSEAPGPVVIPGPAIKGMLRQNLGALLAAPMERVQERTFSFRPNLKPSPGSNARLTVEPVLIIGVERTVTGEGADRKVAWTLTAQQLNHRDDRNERQPHSIVFVNSRLDVKPIASEQLAVGTGNAQANLNRIRGKTIPEVECYRDGFRTKTRPGRGRQVLAEDYVAVNYLSGADGKGSFGMAFNGRRGYKEMLVRLGSSSITITGEVINRYIDTLDHLRDSAHGHLRDHPEKDLDQESVKGNLTTLIDSHLHGLLGCVVFLEIMPKSGGSYEIVSMGHHYRYRWRYKDSVHRSEEHRAKAKHPAKPDDLRAILCPVPLELQTNDRGEPAALTGARLLFGYVGSQRGNDAVNEPLTFGIGGKPKSGDEASPVDPEAKEGQEDPDSLSDYSQWAGRIACNAAVEVVDSNRCAPSIRFVNGDVAQPNGNAACLVPLRALAAPKPSAVENYLRQTGGRHDAGALLTYGDSSDDPSGELGGRKFYLHQPQAAKDASMFELLRLDDRGNALIEPGAPGVARENLLADDAAVLTSDQGAMGRYVSAAGTRFRCKIRVLDLRMWELGALLLAVEPTVERVRLLFDSVASQMSGKTRDRVADALRQLEQSADTSGPVFANKLGHGRPLGMGSVELRVAKLRRVELVQDATLPRLDIVDDSTAASKAIQAFADFLAKSTAGNPIDVNRWFDEVFLPWLEVHRFAGQDAKPYPRPDGKNYHVYDHHTGIRQEHAKQRRTTKDSRKRG